MKLVIDGQQVPLETPSEASLLDISLAAGIPHLHVCQGQARCSTCRVRVVEGDDLLTPPTAAESALAAARGFPPSIRLACQCVVRPTASGTLRVQRLVRDYMDVDTLKTADAAGVRELELVILFSDIRGFTSFAEHRLPYDTVHILNRYFHVMGDVVHRHGGVIDKYMGDGLMALFGVAGEPLVDSARQGLLAGLDMLDALGAFNHYLSEIGCQAETLSMGVGLHVGTVVYGDMGHPDKVMRTAIGDPVNVASRLESATKGAGYPLLASEDLCRILEGRLTSAGDMQVALKGKSQPIRAFKVAAVD
ncbi:hypothetical protein JCM17960_19990 [Magnetospira thiophila]